MNDITANRTALVVSAAQEELSTLASQPATPRERAYIHRARGYLALRLAETEVAGRAVEYEAIKRFGFNP